MKKLARYIFIDFALSDKKLLLHPNEGNEYVRKNYKEDEYITWLNKLWLVNPYRKDHPGIHNDPSVINDGSQPIPLFNMRPIQVPKGEFFMMGDNRDHSNDSRFWGTVEYRYIVGKPWFIYFSWDKNKEIRWNRVFSSVESLTNDTKKNQEIEHEEGIY